VTDLHGWITQQIDRVEALATAATPGPWEGVVDHHQRGEINASVWSDKLGYYITEKISSGERHEADARHIGEHDPAAVLRRCTADRKILARHRLDLGNFYEPACHGCRTYSDQDMAYTDNLSECPELLDLAHAHGITPQILASLDQPETPPRPEQVPRGGYLPPGIGATADVPPALRGPNWPRDSKENNA
jgi:hypothetical protein